MPNYTLSVNDKMMSVEADADTPLLWVLRDNLNLVGTKITAQGMQQLKMMAALEDLYLGQTFIKGNDFINLQKKFPKTILDSGNYHVESFASDTQILKAPPVKK